ncbi:helix-turn-helix domain-containing protein [Dokdonella sp.]|nr:helix-turn-helix domain-containing protein [Dokdonella sp.]
MLELVTLTWIGFSLVATILLASVAATVYRDAQLSPISRIFGVVLLTALFLLQLAHADWLMRSGVWSGSPAYLAVLFLAAASFFLFFSGALSPDSPTWPQAIVVCLPVLLAFVIPTSIAIPLAFACGTAGAIRLAMLAHKLRSQRANFRLERGVFLMHALIALTMLVVGIASPWLGLAAFYTAYSILIGAGLCVSLYLLLHYPGLPTKAAEAVATAYAVSTLGKVDVTAAAARLRQLMEDERVYLDENLSLGRLAARVGLSTHQLSELVNREFGSGFSRFVRGYRVEAAKRMLLDEPQASVLSIGLAVGFSSQSTFYSAFREVTGEVPGRYRERCQNVDPGAR